jgi:hypothetical protein
MLYEVVQDYPVLTPDLLALYRWGAAVLCHFSRGDA